VLKSPHHSSLLTCHLTHHSSAHQSFYVLLDIQENHIFDENLTLNCERFSIYRLRNASVQRIITKRQENIHAEYTHPFLWNYVR
jgi:hypothetical protein